ncbi:MAG: hypothetical protein ACTHKE_04315 [Sphingomicrobium sp.]
MARKDRLFLMAERGRFLVTTDSDETWDGLLLDWDESNLVLVDVSQVALNGDRLKADGELWLPRTRIKYMQKA